MPPKFGLIKMQGFAKGAGLKGSGAAKPKPAVLKPAAFRFCGGDDDDEEDSVARADEDDDAKDRRAARGLRGAAGVDVRGVNASLVQLQAHSSAAAERLKQQALAADANVFAYDELYDDMQANRTDKQANRAKDFDPSSGQAGRKESRYIEQLKKSADIRKVDDERLFQMKLKKEADAEAHIYGDPLLAVSTPLAGNPFKSWRLAIVCFIMCLHQRRGSLSLLWRLNCISSSTLLLPRR